jgi:hypothetical protein
MELGGWLARPERSSHTCSAGDLSEHAQFRCGSAGAQVPSCSGPPCPKGSAFQDFPTPPSNGSARRSAVGLLGSNTLFTGLKGYPAVLYTYQLGR